MKFRKNSQTRIKIHVNQEEICTAVALSYHAKELRQRRK
jgi:hypothetical protein